MKTTNKVYLTGYVSSDPEKLELKNGGVGAKFRMATYQSYTEIGVDAQVKMEWHRIVSFAEAAERVLRIVKKGRLVEVEGRLSTRSYVDRNNQRQTSTSVVVERVQIHELPADQDPELDATRRLPAKAAQ